MSVQKYIISKESANFTIVSNKVIQALKGELELLGFYVYLLSLPPEWTFHKLQLKETCFLGIKKLERFLRQLAQMRLVEVAQMRKENGEFAHFDLRILNGESFIINKLVDAQPCVNNRTTVNGGTVMGSYKRNIDKINIKKEKIKSSCASDDARESSSPSSDDIKLAEETFESFWAQYKRKKDKNRAFEIWVKLKLWEKSEEIIGNLIRQNSLDSQYQTMQFIPYPTTYLRNARWQDEITPVKEHPITASIREMKEAARKSKTVNPLLLIN